MKANELMIGDWVLHNGIAKRVDVIWSDHSISFYNPNKTWGSIYADRYDISEMSPIPLSPEILINNGFKNDFYEDISVADYHSIRLEGYSLRGKVDDWDNYLVSYCNGSVCVVTDFHGEMNKEMQYVHELQHALKLCGIEKEIEL